MRVLLFIAICALCLFGANRQELYEKALAFEQDGDYKNAMFYYKILAQQDTHNSQHLAVMSVDSKDSKRHLDDQEILSQDFSKSTSNTYNQDDEVNEFLGLRIYEPIYLIGAYDFGDKIGRNNQELKFQISFQKPFFYDTFGLNETISFAYTQASWWQLWEESSPFRETNYRPEIFMNVPIDIGAIKYLQLGVLHESNGEGGDRSRSWNKAYLQTAFKFGDFEITPRIWQSFFVADENDDIAAYLGYTDLRLTYTYNNHKFSALLRNNLRFNGNNRGAAELGWMFPIFNSGVHGYLQYFTGYGESLIDYNRRVDKVGIGFAIFK